MNIKSCSLGKAGSREIQKIVKDRTGEIREFEDGKKEIHKEDKIKTSEIWNMNGRMLSINKKAQ